MKKNFTTLFVIGALLFFSASNVFSQPPEWDVSKYYLIINYNTTNVIGIDDMNPLLDGALVQQQENLAPIGTDGHLWQVVAVTDSTVRFINKRSNMALGWTDWVGINPFFDPDEDPPTTKPAFDWRGKHEGAAQRELDVEDYRQEWQPSQFPVTSVRGDTTVWRMTSAFELADSGHCFNVWERTADVGMRNICIFPGVMENDLYIDCLTLYAYYFVATAFEVPPSSIEQRIIQNSFVIYSSDGYIVVEGNIRNQEVEVYNILGGLVYRDNATSARMDIGVKEGIYVIRIGDFISKIAVQ